MSIRRTGGETEAQEAEWLAVHSRPGSQHEVSQLQGLGRFLQLSPRSAGLHLSEAPWSAALAPCVRLLSAACGVRTCWVCGCGLKPTAPPSLGAVRGRALLGGTLSPCSES